MYGRDSMNTYWFTDGLCCWKGIFESSITPWIHVDLCDMNKSTDSGFVPIQLFADTYSGKQQMRVSLQGSLSSMWETSIYFLAPGWHILCLSLSYKWVLATFIGNQDCSLLWPQLLLLSEGGNQQIRNLFFSIFLFLSVFLSINT